MTPGPEELLTSLVSEPVVTPGSEVVLAPTLTSGDTPGREVVLTPVLISVLPLVVIPALISGKMVGFLYVLLSLHVGYKGLRCHRVYQKLLEELKIQEKQKREEEERERERERARLRELEAQSK